MDTVRKFFGVVATGQTYLNILYLLLSFPLGLLYFIFIVTGLSLGFGLLVVWVGIPILLLVLAGWWAMARFERWLAITLLRQSSPPMQADSTGGLGMWDRFKAHLRNPVTWKSLAYLLAKLPLGTFSFTVAVALISLAVGLVTAPLTYRFLDIGVGGWWQVRTLGQALLAAGAGLVVGLLSLHVMNWLARISGLFAGVMLGTRRHGA